LFQSWEKLPFACSYLPGKVPMWIRALQLFAILGLLPAENALLLACVYHELAFYTAVVLLIGGGVSMHVMPNEARRSMPLKYEELPEPAVHSLNLLK
jgi:ABC-type transport system involved in cytochrome c biogenesis permease subunit